MQPDFVAVCEAFGVPVRPARRRALADDLAWAFETSRPGGGGAEDTRSLDPDVTDWSGLVKPSLVGVLPYDPGESVSQLMARYGLDRVWKLNWNEDLFGPLDGVLDARGRGAGEHLDVSGADLRRPAAGRSAGWLGVPSREVVSAHGIQALVGMVAARS